MGQILIFYFNRIQKAIVSFLLYIHHIFLWHNIFYDLASTNKNKDEPSHLRMNG